MNKLVIAVIVILVGLTGAFVVYSGGDDDSSPSNTTVSSTNTPTGSTDAPEQIPATKTPGEGNYVTFTDTAIADAAGTNRVLFFHATWCSVCNFFEGQIEDQGVPEGVTIIKANYDEDRDLRDQYGVNVQSTFVLLDDNGDILQTWPFASGLQDIQDLYDAVI